MDECRSMGIVLKGPDINESELNFTVNKTGDIRFGLGGVKGVGVAAVESIVKERNENGSYKSVYDFFERVNLTSCNKKNIEALCYAGAFDAYQDIKREQFFATNARGEIFLETLMRYGNKYQTDKNTAMYSLFGGSEAVDIAKPEAPVTEAWSNIERLNKEKDVVGIYLSSHPLDDYFVILNYICNLELKDFETSKDNNVNKDLIIGGIVTSYTQGNTKTGNLYGKLKLEDFSGSAEILLFGNDFIEYSKYGHPNICLLVKGKFQPRQYKETVLDFRISSIRPLTEVKDSMVNKITLAIPLHELDEGLITELSFLMKNNPGGSSLYFKIEDIEKHLSVSLFTENQKFSVSKEIIRFLEEKNIKFMIN